MARLSLTTQKPLRYRSGKAQVAELVDALVSGTSGESRGGSSPLLGTRICDIAVRNLFLDDRSVLDLSRGDSPAGDLAARDCRERDPCRWQTTTSRYGRSAAAPVASSKLDA
jgi:hypothetical protein